jgi:hypothetical protein
MPIISILRMIFSPIRNGISRGLLAWHARTLIVVRGRILTGDIEERALSIWTTSANERSTNGGLN